MKLQPARTLPPNGDGLCVPASARTLAGFRDWIHSIEPLDYGRICFINGNIHIDMSPDEIETHNKVVHAIDFGIEKVNATDDLGEYFRDGALLTNKSANLATVPDGSFAKWETSTSGRIRLVPRKDRHGQFVEVQGSPDWVFEAVSFSSVTKDTVELPASYHRARIPEFWLVDARGADIDFQIMVWQPRKYRRSQHRQGWTYSPVFSRWFRLVRRPNRLGRWSYRLEFKRS
jgi:Uma2 family endonuclease